MICTFGAVVLARAHYWGTDEGIYYTCIILYSIQYYGVIFVERKLILQEAISEAKLNENLQAQVISKSPRSYKKVLTKSQEEGRARVLMEDMVHRSERKLLNLKRKKYASNKTVEDIALDLFHRPGILLKLEELNIIYKESGCSDIVTWLPSSKCSKGINMIYRTLNGTCNNLEKINYGSAGIAFRRLLQALYEDGVSTPLGHMQAYSNASNRGPFDPPKPSARLVSSTVVTEKNANDKFYTNMLMQWGQFIDHDMSLAPELQAHCKSCQQTDKCEPIQIPLNDPVFGNGRGSSDDGLCLQFKRSVPVCVAPNQNDLTPRQQRNDITSFIDGSLIYGNSENESDFLRAHKDGLMLMDSGGYLPVDASSVGQLYITGDGVRANEHTGLVTLHTLWVREHNRIARKLKSLNQHWTDQRIWLEARKIVGAELQKITYYDYLVKVLGYELFDKLLVKHCTAQYDTGLDATIPNEFATAAYRFGHSQVQPVLSRFSTDMYHDSLNKPLSLLASFFNTTAFLETDIDAILRGLVSDSSSYTDEHLDSILTTSLFEGSVLINGSDLAALNIQRQRDHGMPSYVTMKNFCLNQFSFLPSLGVENEITRMRLEQVYGTMETVDLWVGGLTEEKINGSLIGPTFACIFGLTFCNLKTGDRFWYENEGVFAPDQLEEINKITLSRVICDNTDNIHKIPEDSFCFIQRELTVPSCKKWI